MLNVISGSDSVNCQLPKAPAGLEYRRVSLTGGEYVTTGCFETGGLSRTRKDLKAVGCMVLDFDLADYAARVNNWSGSPDEIKALLYNTYGDIDTLSALKESHAADVETLVEEADEVLGTGKPTVTVDSGWGLHLYFWLSEFVTDQQKIDDIRALNKRLADLINEKAGYEIADPGVHDAGTRLLRRVGSTNDKSNDWSLNVYIVDEMTYPDERFDIKNVEPSAPLSRSQRGGGVARESLSAGRKVRQMIGYLCQVKSVKDAYDEAAAKQESEDDMSLACSLANQNVPQSVIGIVLRAIVNPQRHADMDDYVARTAFAAHRQVYGDAFAANVSPDDNYKLMHEAALIELESGLTKYEVARRIAQYDPRIANMIWLDERSRYIIFDDSDVGTELMSKFYGFMGIAAPRRANRKIEFNDDCATLICSWIDSTYGVKIGRETNDAVRYMTSSLEKRNPLRAEIEKCGESVDVADNELLETWLIRAFDLEDTQMIRSYSRKWIVGGVARAIDPGVFIKGMLVLTGEQSAGKTTLLRVIGGEFYGSPSVQDLSSKDALMATHKSWLIELEEMDFMKKNTIEAVKKYLTTQSDDIRLPYGRITETFHRSCFYAGTANRADILADSTGNDRFWCVEIPDGHRCDFDYVRSIRSKLLGSAYKAWMSVRELDETSRVLAINLAQDELVDLRAHNQGFSREDALAEIVKEAAIEIAAMRPRRDGDIKGAYYVKVAEFQDYLYTSKNAEGDELRKNRMMQNRVEDILRQAGWTHKRSWVNRAENDCPTAYFVKDKGVLESIESYRPAARQTVGTALRVVQ